MAALGWLGLHVPEEHGGSGYGLPELVVVVEELGRALAPGPFVPTVIASAVLVAAAANGDPRAAAARAGRRLARRRGRASAATVDGARRRAAHGTVGVVLGGGLADVLLVAAGDDVAVVDLRGPRRRRSRCPRTSTRRRRRGPGRRSTARRSRSSPGAGRSLVDLARAPVRGRGRRHRPRVHRPGGGVRQGARAVRPADRHVPGGQAPLRQHARGRRAGDRRRVGRGPGRRGPAATSSPTRRPWPPRSRSRPPTWNAQLNIQVHGGIGFTWEHDAHLYLRRATALESAIDRRGGRRSRSPTCVRRRRRP